MYIFTIKLLFYNKWYIFNVVIEKIVRDIVENNRTRWRDD